MTKAEQTKLVVDECAECEGTGYYHNAIDNISIDDEEVCFKCDGKGWEVK